MTAGSRKTWEADENADVAEEEDEEEDDGEERNEGRMEGIVLVLPALVTSEAADSFSKADECRDSRFESGDGVNDIYDRVSVQDEVEEDRETKKA